MGIIRLLKVADILTIGNFVSGIFSIFSSIKGDAVSAAAFIFLAVAFDFFDGRVARMLKQQNSFGKELDSLADLTSFGVAPAVAAYSLIPAGSFGAISKAIAVFYATAAMLRLARFNISKIKGFEGLPTTAAAIGFAAMLVVFSAFKLPMSGLIILLYMLASGMLMISSVKIKKL